jgi:hypothetical protein
VADASAWTIQQQCNARDSSDVEESAGACSQLSAALTTRMNRGRLVAARPDILDMQTMNGAHLMDAQ